MSRNLLVLCGVSFLMDASSELLYPVLPIFLTVTLGAPAAVVGLVEGVAEGAAAFTKLYAGRLADRVARRPVIAMGYGLAALGKILIAAATAWPVVLAGRAVDRLGKGVRGAPRDALLVVGVPPEARGRAFGLHRAADTAGAVVGPLLGLAAYEALDHRIRPLLLLAVVPAVASVALVAAVREAPRPAAPARPPTTPTLPKGEDATRLPPGFWRVVTLLAAFGLVNFPDALLLLRVSELGYALPGVIGVYVAYNTSYALLSYPAGALSDRWPRHRVFALGLGCFAMAYLGLGLIDDPAGALPLLIVYGGFTACTDGVGKAWVSGLAPAARQGSGQGIYQGLTGAAVLVAGVWAGLAWGGTGQMPLLISGGVAAGLTVLVAARGAALTKDSR